MGRSSVLIGGAAVALGIAACSSEGGAVKRVALPRVGGAEGTATGAASDAGVTIAWTYYWLRCRDRILTSGVSSSYPINYYLEWGVANGRAAALNILPLRKDATVLPDTVEGSTPFGDASAALSTEGELTTAGNVLRFNAWPYSWNDSAAQWEQVPGALGTFDDATGRSSTSVRYVRGVGSMSDAQTPRCIVLKVSEDSRSTYFESVCTVLPMSGAVPAAFPSDQEIACDAL